MNGDTRRSQSQTMAWYRHSRIANHFIEGLDKDDPFKVIYGVEGYLVDDLTGCRSE